MCGSWDEVQSVPVGEGVGAVAVAETGVHDVADGFVVVHRGAGGDAGVRLAVEVQDLAAGFLEVGQVRVGGLEDVGVAVPAELHPVAEGVVGDVVEGGEVVCRVELEEPGDPFAAKRGDGEFPRVRLGVVLCLCVVEAGAGLVPDVGAPALRVVQAFEHLGGHGGALAGDGAVLGWGGVGHADAFAELHGACRGGAGVGVADGGVDVEVELAEVGAGDDAVLLAVEGVAGGDGQIHDLLQLAGGRVVVHGLLDDVRVQVVGLLLAVAHGGSSDYETVQVVEPLGLTPAITTTLGAALVVSVDLGVVRDTKEVACERLADDTQFVDSLVSEHVDGIQVSSTVCQRSLRVQLVGEAAEATVCLTSSSTVDNTTGQGATLAVDRETTTTGRQPTVLELLGSRKPDLQQDLVILSGMGVRQSHVAVVKGGIGEEGFVRDRGVVHCVGRDRGVVERDALRNIMRKSTFDIRRSADGLQRGRISGQREGRSRES